MEHRALRLPRAEPLLHVPISAIVEFVSNRSEAEVLLRIGDLAHEFDHLTVSLVQWLEHQQYLSIDSRECLPALGAGQSLTSSLAPLIHQARAANRHGVRVLQQKISETLAQLQRHMDAVEVFSNQNASFSQELQLCGLRDRADQRRRLAETESTLASRLSRFLGGCDSLYDEHPSPLAMNLAAGTTSGGRATGGGSGGGGGGARADAAAAAAAASIAKPAVAPSPSTPAVTPTAVAPAVAPAAVAPVAPATYDTGTAAQRREHTCAKEAQRAYLTRDNTDDPKHPPGSGGKYACTGGSTGRKRPRPPLPEAENVGTGSTHHGDSTEEATTHEDDRYHKQPRQQQQQQQQQQLTQDEEDDVHDDDGSFPAPSFLTPPLIAAAPAVSGSGNRATPGLVAAPHSACSSLGSTPSTGSSSPALAVASPAPTPKSSPRRLADGESMGNRPGGGGAGGGAAAASEATPWNAYGGHGRRRARADSDGGGGGAVGLGEVTVLAAAASTTGGGGAVAGPLSEEQPHSSLGFGSSPTPPSTREPSPPPLSTQEGSVSAAEGIGDNDRMGERKGEEQEEDSTTARDSEEGGVYGSFWPAQGGGGRGTGKTGPGGEDAAAAVAAAADRALAVAGADASGAGGVSGFLLRAPPPTCRNGVEVAESLQEGGRDSGAEERENEVGEEEEEEGDGGDEVDDEDMLETAETVEDSMLPALLAAPTAIADATAPDEEEEAAAEAAADAPPCWGSQDGADEAGGADAEAGLTGGVGTRAGRSGGLGSGRT